MLADYNYQDHNDSAEVLANRIINQLKVEGNLSFPIDPFYLLSRFNIDYKLLNFDTLEGIYIVPDNDEDGAIVGINKNRPISRQRFTAAHEICHHIKDRQLEYILCPIDGRKNNIEKFADLFASFLLMPPEYMQEQINLYEKDGYVSFDDALKISSYFGTSFQSCVYTLAYRCNRIEGDIERKTLRKRIDKFKPDRRKIELSLVDNTLLLKKQLINSYSFVNYVGEDIKWYKFKNFYIANEERLEGSMLEFEEIFKIITDLRFNKQDSIYCHSDFQHVIETAGQVAIFDYIFDPNVGPTLIQLKTLHKKLYQFSLFPEYSGTYRTTNNYVNKSKLETTSYSSIYAEVFLVEKDIEELLINIHSYSHSDFIEKAALIHHKITAIHPFDDGNGRVSRSILNWLLNLKGIYPIFVTLEKKGLYLRALEHADQTRNVDLLTSFIIDEIIESDMILNNFNPY